MTVMGRPRAGLESGCLYCGVVLYSPPSRQRRYCSYVCRAAGQRAMRVNTDNQTARCSRCQEWKPISLFVAGRGGSPHSYCKTCSSTWFHERRGTPEEKRKPYQTATTLTPEEKRIRTLEHAKAYRQNNKEKIAFLNRLRRLKNRGSGPMPDRMDMQALMCCQDWRCTYCAATLVGGSHIDHKLPVSRGGTNQLENFQYLCPTCNMKKSAKTHEEYSARIGYVKPQEESAPFDILAFNAAMEAGLISEALAVMKAARQPACTWQSRS